MEPWLQELAKVTLEEAWAIVHRAWRDRRRRPELWRLIVNSVHFVGLEQAREDSATPKAPR